MIESLQLKNFKNFQDATLPLGKLTLLVGTNASGKSNLRDAFRFLHGIGRGYSLAEICGQKWAEGTLQWNGIRGGWRELAYEGQTKFALTTKRKGWGEHFIEVDVGHSRSGPIVVQEALHSRGMLDFETCGPAEKPGHISVHLRGAKRNEGFSDGKPVLSQLSEKKKAIGAPLIQDLGWMRFLELAPEAMKTPSVPGQAMLGDRGENLSSVLQAICMYPDKKRAVIEWIRQLTPMDVQDLDFLEDQTGKILINLIERGGRRTSAYSASDGTLRFLAMLAAMLGSDIGEAPACFYFIEEIDAGIHPTRLHLLVELIEEAVARADIQVVATTHSPLLLGFLSEPSREAATLAYRLPHHGEARLRRIMDIPDARQVLATRDLGRLHESGWLENVVFFLEAEPNAEEVTA